MVPQVRKILRVVDPLAEFYEAGSDSVPKIEVISGNELPEPYLRLLNHRCDMTPTLEQYFGQELHLKALSVITFDGEIHRQVVLTAGDKERPVEFGAIVIHIRYFEEEPRALILEAKVPLGTILARYQIQHRCRADAFFKFPNDAVTERALGVSGDQILYGRHNRLIDEQDRLLAEAVEILPPLP